MYNGRVQIVNRLSAVIARHLQRIQVAQYRYEPEGFCGVGQEHNAECDFYGGQVDMWCRRLCALLAVASSDCIGSRQRFAQ